MTNQPWGKQGEIGGLGVHGSLTARASLPAAAAATRLQASAAVAAAAAGLMTACRVAGSARTCRYLSAIFFWSAMMSPVTGSCAGEEVGGRKRARS